MIPATLLLALAIILALLKFVSGQTGGIGGGINSFAFGFTQGELVMVAVAVLGIIIVLGAVLASLFLRYKRQKVNR